MRFTVTWHPDARDDLARCWIESSNRNAITAATQRIDLQLANDPQSKGVDFYGDRLFADAPLAVVFSVSVADCIVQILRVWHQ